jgi:hypothetical protein
MRIGILTYHRSINAGAFWQAYATQNLLKELGHEVLIIDYCLPAHRYNVIKKILNPAIYLHPCYAIDNLCKQITFAKERKKFFRTTEFIESKSKLKQLKFKAVIIGSDVIWDFNSAVRGNLSVYFGEHINTDRLISFAASCGPTDAMADIPEYVKDGLKSFYAISVRDINTANLVKRITGKLPTIALDPCFHLNTRLLISQRQIPYPYLIVYDSYDLGKDDNRAVLGFAKKHELKIIGIGYRRKWVDINLAGIDPVQWLNLLFYADYIVTNAFHGVVFGLLFRKPFVVRLNESTAKKTTTMLDMLGMQWVYTHDAAQINTILSAKWDYSGIISRIETHKAISLDFLKKALG